MAVDYAKLVAPSFVDRDVTGRTAELVRFYEDMTGKKLLPAQPERLLIDLIVYAETVLRESIQAAGEMNLPAYAEGAALEHLASFFGLSRLAAKSAKMDVTVTIAPEQAGGAVFPAGWQAEFSGVVFTAPESFVIPAGSHQVGVTLVCEEPGVAGNGVPVGMTGNVVEPVAGEEVVAVSMSMGGADEEGDDGLRERLRLAPDGFSVAGPAGAYRYFAMAAHQDVIDVAVAGNEPGVVDVYPLTKDGLPGNEVIAAVYDSCSADTVRPLCDTIRVLPPAEIVYELRAVVTPYSWADAAHVADLAGEAAQGYVDTVAAGLGRDVVVSALVAAMMVAGCYRVEVISPGADIVAAPHEWPRCSGITIDIAEAVDG